MFYKAIGFVVWRALKWYLRQRVLTPRTLALGAASIAAGGVLTALAVRRLGAED